MSSNFKFSSSSSTPAKVKPPNDSITPFKTSKYRSFLAALTPSRSKKRIKQNNLSRFEESSISKDGEKQVDKKTHLSDDSDEPGYSSIGELQFKQRQQESDENSFTSTKHGELSSQQHLSREPPEPLYATINKKKSGEVKKLFQDENLQNKNIFEEQKEEIQLLVERLKELTSENRELRKNVETVLKEEKWKEDALHAKLKLEISQLEANTHKEVKCLSEQIKTLLKEREVLASEIETLHLEKKELQSRYNEVCLKTKEMISSEFFKKTVDEHQKSLSQMENKLRGEINSLQQENKMLSDSKLSLMDEVDDLKEKIKTLVVEKESLKNSERELRQENAHILCQLEETKLMQQEAQNLLVSLLKITENLSMEREILFNKTVHQDQQQNMLKSSIIDYSLNMGRLQEHVSNLNKDKLDELQKFKTGKYVEDETVRNMYDKQVELLRSKVLNQNSTINELEGEKSKLELQLGSLWQAACIQNPKMLEEIKYNL